MNILYFILLTSLTIFLVYIHKKKTAETFEGIKTACQNEETKLRQLSIQENTLNERNKELEHNLNETVTIYEYVKNLGSTMDFSEGLKVFQKALNTLTEFSIGRLVLIENGNIQKIYNIYYGQESPSQCNTGPREFEKNIIDKMTKDTLPIIYTKEKRFSIEQLPPDINTLLAIPLTAPKQLAAILTLENMPLADIDRIRFVADQFALEVKKTQLYERVRELSIIDSLTGLYLRRHFLELLNNELDRCHRRGEPLSLLMADIDWFKRYNDGYGHLAGDLILKTISSILKNKCREIDLLCRYGGDEFAIALPKAGKKEAQLVAERLRQGVNDCILNIAGEEFHVTISIGIAAFVPKDMNVSGISVKLIDLADKAMYQAKSQGRNLIV